MTALRTVTIELYDEEYIALRGMAEVHWFVRVNDSWLHASKIPGAREERLDPGPGVVYRTRMELDVTPGTKLMRVESKPQLPRSASTMEHLFGAKISAARRTLRKLYAVNRRGFLVPLPATT